MKINDVTQAEGNSSNRGFNFTLTLSAISSRMVIVWYAPPNGSARAGSDYIAVGVTPLTFLPGQTVKVVSIYAKGDLAKKANETFFVNLSAPSGATLADSQGQGTITNDD